MTSYDKAIEKLRPHKTWCEGARELVAIGAPKAVVPLVHAYETPVEGLWFVGAQSQSGAGLNNVMHGVWQAVTQIRSSISS